MTHSVTAPTNSMPFDPFESFQQQQQQQQQTQQPSSIDLFQQSSSHDFFQTTPSTVSTANDLFQQSSSNNNFPTITPLTPTTTTTTTTNKTLSNDLDFLMMSTQPMPQSNALFPNQPAQSQSFARPQMFPQQQPMMFQSNPQQQFNRPPNNNSFNVSQQHILHRTDKNKIKFTCIEYLSKENYRLFVGSIS